MESMERYVRTWHGMERYENAMRGLRRDIVPSFLCHSHSSVAMERTKM